MTVETKVLPYVKMLNVNPPNEYFSRHSMGAELERRYPRKFLRQFSKLAPSAI